MRNLIPLVLAVSACHAAGDNHKRISDAEVATERAWKKLPDGSWGWQERSPSRKFISEQAERCWPNKGSWDCLSVSTLVEASEVGPPTVFASRYIKTQYYDPQVGIGDDSVQGGYVCQFIRGKVLQEGIFQNSKGGVSNTLQSNDVVLGDQYGGAVWSPDFVVRYMRENNVEPTLRYLNCLHVTGIVSDHSLATINTTSLAYGMMTGRDDVMLYDMEGRKEEP